MVAAGRVLIVEDECIVQLHLRMVMQDLGFEVTGVAASYDEALASAQRNVPQIVLMDIRLAGGSDGIEAARELRARHDLDVVFLTAHADERTVARAQSVGPVGYLVKPFSKPQLRATLSTAMRRQARTVPTLAKSEVPALRRKFGAGTRMAIYSHDTLGLGHLQRNLNLAWALTSRFPDLSILLLTGSAALHRFPLPPGVDTIKLPSVRKVGAERYEARSLHLHDEQVLDLRRSLTLRAIQGFDPHVLLVDHAPIGMAGELVPTLDWLARERPGCIKIAGLRDVVDSPERVQRAWSERHIRSVLEESYDHIVIYGSPEIFDTAGDCGFSERLRQKTRYCGYVGRFRPTSDENESLPPFADTKPRVLVTIGGGDGAGEEILGTWLRMLRIHRARVDFESLLLSGPFLDRELSARFRTERDGLPVQLVDFVASTRPYHEHADLVVCTGGYNTTIEAIAFAGKALVIPRRMHREEQVVRARRFEELGLVTVLDPADATPDRLFADVVQLLDDPRRPLVEARAKRILDLDGAQRFVDFCSGLEVAG